MFSHSVLSIVRHGKPLPFGTHNVKSWCIIVGGLCSLIVPLVCYGALLRHSCVIRFLSVPNHAHVVSCHYFQSGKVARFWHDQAQRHWKAMVIQTSWATRPLSWCWSPFTWASARHQLTLQGREYRASAVWLLPIFHWYLLHLHTEG